MISFHSHTDVSFPVLTPTLFFPPDLCDKISVYQWHCKHPFSIFINLPSDPNVRLALCQLTLRMGDRAIAIQYCFACRMSVGE